MNIFNARVYLLLSVTQPVYDVLTTHFHTNAESFPSRLVSRVKLTALQRFRDSPLEKRQYIRDSVVDPLDSPIRSRFTDHSR